MPTNTDLDVDKKIKIEPPKMYQVIMHDDDYTPMDYVVSILINIFGKSKNEATNLMWQIHQSKNAIVGIFSYDIAHTKKLQTDKISKANSYPLKITISEVI